MDQPVPNSARRVQNPVAMARKLGMERAKQEMQEGGPLPDVSPMDDMVTGIVTNAGLAQSEDESNRDVFEAFVEGWRSVSSGDQSIEDRGQSPDQQQEGGSLIEPGAALTAESKRPSESVFI